MIVYPFVKRAFDAVLAFLVVLFLLPFFLLAGILIKLDSKGPVFFRQDRLGVGGRPFKVYKLRSMYLGAEKLGVYEAKDDPRVTRIGRFLRRTSLNELPQFINILKGDMSLIGPRPVLPFHPWPIEEYTVEQRKRFQVRPGLTGWAQVNGRKNVPWPERLKLDGEYVDRLSAAFDARILLKTVAVVLSGKDNYNEGVTGGRANDAE